MLAARNENRLRRRSGGLAPRTPGTRRALNDENAVTLGKRVIGGTSRGQNQENTVLRGKQAAFTTPVGGNRNRAPLGMKTTNAKARTTQQLGPKQQKMLQETLENAITRPKPKTVSSKLEVRSDPKPPKPEIEIECAPIAPDVPYESDILPAGGISLDGLKPENLFGGYYERFVNPVNDNGKRLRDIKLEEDLDKALKTSEREILRDIENTNWTVTDVPESQQLLQKKSVSSARPPAMPTVSRVPSIRAGSSLSSRSGSSASGSFSSLAMPRVRPLAAGSKPSAKMPSWLQPKKQPTRDSSDPVKVAAARAAAASSSGSVRSTSSSSSTTTRKPTPTAPTKIVALEEPRETIVPPSPARKPLARPQYAPMFDNDESEDETNFKAGNQTIDYDDDMDFEL